MAMEVLAMATATTALTTMSRVPATSLPATVSGSVTTNPPLLLALESATKVPIAKRAEVQQSASEDCGEVPGTNKRELAHARTLAKFSSLLERSTITA